jgi:hypothetical protein
VIVDLPTTHAAPGAASDQHLERSGQMGLNRPWNRFVIRRSRHGEHSEHHSCHERKDSATHYASFD